MAESVKIGQASEKATIIDRLGAARTGHFIANWRQLVLVLARGELRPGHLKAAKAPPYRSRA
jgi:hypothetical protein